MPKYQKKFLTNASQYFDPSSDNAFKEKHPFGYIVLMLCGISALLLPSAVLLFVTDILYPVETGGFIILAILGTFIIGIGLFNIVSVFINQYLGHWITIGCFLIGGVLVAISLIICYNRDNFTLFDENLETYYFTTWLFLALPPLFYIPFRFAVGAWLKTKGISKAEFNKLMKGNKNFWWYNAIHEKVDLGLIYYANKTLTILYPITVLLALTLGWIRFTTPVITFLYVIMCVLTAGMHVFSSVQNHKATYGKPIILLRRTPNKGFTSSFFELVPTAIILYAGYAHFLLMLDAFHIPR